jgi:hypothetical protein
MPVKATRRYPHDLRQRLHSACTQSCRCSAFAPDLPCVFVQSNLVDGGLHFTLSQVALNDTIMVFAFGPIVGLLLRLEARSVALAGFGLDSLIEIFASLSACRSPSARPRRHRLGPFNSSLHSAAGFWITATPS